MWKIKLIASAIFIVIIGTIIFLLLSPGGDLYGDYVRLGEASKSGFQSKKEFNYQQTVQENTQQGSTGSSSSNTSGNLADLANCIVPDDLTDIEALKSYIDNLPVCDTRRELLHRALSTLGTGQYSMGGHNNWKKDKWDTIECSGFTAWAYNQVGIIIKDPGGSAAPSTHYYKPSQYMTEVPPEERIPGDIGHIYGYERNKSSGHVGLYFGKQASGQLIFIDAGSDTVTKIKPHKQIEKRTFRITEMQALDNEYYSSSN